MDGGNIGNAMDNNIRNLVDKEFMKNAAIVIPFFNEKSKDTLTAKQFIEQIDTQISNTYLNQADAYKRFTTFLRGDAKEWYELLRSRKRLPADFAGLRDKFIVDFNVHRQNVVATKELCTLSQKKDQTVFQFYLRCCRAVEDIYKNQPERDFNGLHILNPNNAQPIGDAAIAAATAEEARIRQLCRDYSDRSTIYMQDVLVRNIFINNLLPHIKSEVFTQDHLDLDEILKMAQRFETMHEEKGAKVASVEETNETSAVRQNGNKTGQKSNSKNYGNKSNGNNGNQTQHSNGANSLKNIKCWFCKKLGHVQTKCFTRLKANAPLVNRNNKTFIVNGNEIVPESGISHDEVAACKEAHIQGYNDNEQDFQM